MSEIANYILAVTLFLFIGLPLIALLSFGLVWVIAKFWLIAIDTIEEIVDDIFFK